MAKHPITRRNTGGKLSVHVIDTRINIRSARPLGADAVACMRLRARLARITAIKAVAGVGEDHLGGGLGIVDPLEMTLSVLDRKAGDDFFIAHGHVAAGYYGVLGAHGYVTEEDVVRGFRTERPIGGHVTPIAGGTLNTGRLGDEAAGVGMAMALEALNKKGIIYVHTSDGSANEGSFMEALELAAHHKLRVIFVCDVNGLQLSGTTKTINPTSDPARKAAAAGVTVMDVTTFHDPAVYYKVLQKAVKHAIEGDGPVFLNPTGFMQPAKAVFPEKGHRGFRAVQKIWIPGSLMGSGIEEWEKNIIETLNKERLGLAQDKPANYHDGNTKAIDLKAVLDVLVLSEKEQTLLAKYAKKKRTETFYARPPATASSGYTQGKVKFFAPSASHHLEDGKTPGDWVSARKGVYAGLAAISASNRKSMLAVGLDLEGSTQINALFKNLDSSHAFQAGIQERGGILAAGGAAYKLLKETASRKGKIPTTTTGTFSSFLFSTGQEGLDFINYQEDINATVAGLPVKIICSHTGMNPGKDGLTAQYIHAVDAVYNLIRLKRAFMPADANHALHIIRELYRLADFAMYIGPRSETPVIDQKSGKAYYGSQYKFRPVDEILKGDGRLAYIVTGPVLYRALSAADILRQEKKINASVYFVGGIKPFPCKEIARILQNHRAVVTVEDGYVGKTTEPDRGLAGLVASVASSSQYMKARCKLGKTGNFDGETMSQAPEVIYDRYGLHIRHNLVKTALKLLGRK